MREETVQILKMVEEGKITADQAVQLIEAGNLFDNSKDRSTAVSGRAKWLRVRVYDINSNKRKVNISIPLSLVSIGLKLGTKFGLDKADLKGIDFNEIIQLIQEGEEGKLVDVIDEESGEKVEVYVD
ncbi:hypothetical protein H0A61_01363 [Koleobacter methoxysyntrophicus]|uniref:YvlB/LiaX N-terminal domain-containing protein n=1 Tax=Koleobacter methoxysyntrophicus TaxID=2751313 RepID=A0A8A0RP73_9FIRM|nr:hypothetical protein [Koleobacter methoxysyntrophicus]QSQ09006.1 hypothetical protein H0A61_01363 [Koleobacter methoxysyntrophicus]